MYTLLLLFDADVSDVDGGGDAGAADAGGRYVENPAISSSAAAAAAGAAAAAAAGGAQLSPCYRPQRVPGARALGPFLQALTASQHMKVSHEVCRVMTASVKVRVLLFLKKSEAKI